MKSIIPENFSNASTKEQLAFCLQVFCNLIYAIGITLIQMIDRLFESSQDPNSLINQTNIKQMEDVNASIQEQIKELRTRISWTMDYVQLANQNKDTKALDEFRKNLEKQFEEDPDEDANDDLNKDSN